MSTRTVNLRNLPDDLVRRAKAHAALSGLSLKEFVVKALERAVEEPLPAFADPSLAMLVAKRQKGATKKRSK